LRSNCVDAFAHSAQFKQRGISHKTADVEMGCAVWSYGLNIFPCKIRVHSAVFDPVRGIQDEFLRRTASQEFQRMKKARIAKISCEHDDNIRALRLVEYQKPPRAIHPDTGECPEQNAAQEQRKCFSFRHIFP